MDFLAPMKPVEVVNSKTLAQYAQQTLGVPLPRGQDYGPLHKQIKEIRKQYPMADWQTFVKLVHWAASRRKRFAHLRQLVACYRFAFKDGCLPELEPGYINPLLEAEINNVLEIEKDDEWRQMLIRARGASSKMTVLQAWKTKRSSPSLAS